MELFGNFVDIVFVDVILIFVDYYVVPTGNHELSDGWLRCTVPKCKYEVQLFVNDVIKNERSFGRLISNFRKHALKHESKEGKNSKKKL